jgi:thiol-disulfide isomerase/thioredoxin
MKKFALLIITTVFLSISAYAQGYKIEVQFDDLKDASIMLGYHFGDKKFVVDTAQVNSKGIAIFEGDSLLPGGMYIVILPQRSYFDFLLSHNQQFSLSTSTDKLLENLKFKGSPENTAFLNYQMFMNEKQKRMGDLRNQMQAVEGNADLEKKITDEINSLDLEVKKNWDVVIKDNPNTFLANIIRSLKPIDFPEFEIPANAKSPDSLRWVKSYQYNQNHFFDNIDLTDDRLIRTPFFQARVDAYFDRALLPIADTIILYGDRLIEKASESRRMYQFLISHLFSKYQNSSIMGMDAVFVHLAEKYYLTGKVEGINDGLKSRIADRVADLKPNLIGKIAPNVSMTDFNNKTHELHKIKAKATVVYFWEPNCSHCKKVTPQLNELYKKYKSQGLEVFAVYTQGETDSWKDYVTKNGLTWINVWDPFRVSQYHKLYDIYSTPIIYVLDKDKRIVAKRIGIESVERIIEEELKR